MILKNWENKGMDKIVLVTPTQGWLQMPCSHDL